ncbi:MAG: hypothetical protein OXF51_10765 [Alphaproteobacteria bacterium]|nr:hypothetical protein [Alphaproteobacteria bacterium]
MRRSWPLQLMLHLVFEAGCVIEPGSKKIRCGMLIGIENVEGVGGDTA